MKKRIALKMLKKQQISIDSLPKDINNTERHNKEDLWKSETINIINSIFGEKSEQYNQIINSDITLNNTISYKSDNRLEKNREKVYNLLGTFITHVKNIGVQTNNISYNKETHFVFSKHFTIIILCALISGIFTLGFYLGKSQIDNNKNSQYIKNIKSISSKIK